MSLNTNKRIAKNVVLLYFRMILNMAITLYMVRVVFNILGINDYGIYNVVGGVVLLFHSLSGSMSRVTQRFLSYELGKVKNGQFANIFSHAFAVHFILAVAFLLLAETIGLWFLNSQLNISFDRMDTARMVFHFSVCTFLITIMSVPFNAAIIAYERMDVFAYVSLIEVLLKFVLIFLLSNLNYDKLFLYSFLVFMVALITSIIYILYSVLFLKGCRINFYFEKRIFQELSSFLGLNIVNQYAWMTVNQGINIILNIYFGTAINTSRGIAYQVNNAVSQFVNNFRTAFNPPIVKLGSSGKDNEMIKLTFDSAKYTYILILLFALPLIIETNYILLLWLGSTPGYVIIFCRLVLLNTQIQCFEGSFYILFEAIGRIKEIYIYSAIVYVTSVAICYFIYALGFLSPLYAFYVQIVATIIVSFGNTVYLLNKVIGITLSNYVKWLILPILKVTPFAICFAILPSLFMEQSFLRLLITFLLSTLSIIIFTYLFLVPGHHKKFIISFIVTKWEEKQNYLKKG